MADEHRAWRRQGEAFWRAHHEAWKRSDLNQRQYCEAEGIPLKAFGNWRAKFKAEPQPPERKLLYRRRPLSPPLSPFFFWQAPLFRGRVRGIGAGSATQTNSGSSKRQRDPVRAPRRWHAGMASLNAFYVDGSRSWRRQHWPSSRCRSPMRMPPPATPTAEEKVMCSLLSLKA